MRNRVLAVVLIAALAQGAFAQGSAVPPFTTLFIRTLLDDATQAAARTTLGLGTGDSPTFAGLTILNAITEFSTDDTLAGDSDSAIPTEQAVKAYVDGRAGAGSGNVVWRHIRTDFTLLKKGASPPGEESESIGASGNILAYNYAFNPAAAGDEEVFFHIIIPNDIDESQNVQAFIGWWPDTNWSSGDYRWVLEYLVKDVDDMYGPTVDRTATAPTTIYIEHTPLNATDLIESPFYDPNTIDADRNQAIFCRLSLDASESSGDDDAHLYYMMFQYASNQPGPTQGDRMTYEDADVMLFEDGAVMLFEG